MSYWPVNQRDQGVKNHLKIISWQHLSPSRFKKSVSFFKKKYHSLTFFFTVTKMLKLQNPPSKGHWISCLHESSQLLKILCAILQISNITHKERRQLQACEVQIEVGRFSSKFCSFQGNHFLHKHSLRGDTAVGSSQLWHTHKNTHIHTKAGAHS